MPTIYRVTNLTVIARPKGPSAPLFMDPFSKSGDHLLWNLSEKVATIFCESLLRKWPGWIARTIYVPTHLINTHSHMSLTNHINQPYQHSLSYPPSNPPHQSYQLSLTTIPSNTLICPCPSANTRSLMLFMCLIYCIMISIIL